MSAYDKLSAEVSTVEELIHKATKPCVRCGSIDCNIVENGKHISLKCVNCGNEIAI